MGKYFLFLEGVQKGPYTTGQVQSMWRSGTLTGEVLFYHKDFGEWKPLMSIIELLEPPDGKTPVAQTPLPPVSDLLFESPKSNGPVAATPVARHKRSFSLFEKFGMVLLLCIFGTYFGGFLRDQFNKYKNSSPAYSPQATNTNSVLNKTPASQRFDNSTPSRVTASDRGEAVDDGLNRGHYLGREAAREGIPIPTRETLHDVALRMARESSFQDKEAWALAFENGYAAGYREASERAFK